MRSPLTFRPGSFSSQLLLASAKASSLSSSRLADTAPPAVIETSSSVKASPDCGYESCGVFSLTFAELT